MMDKVIDSLRKIKKILKIIIFEGKPMTPKEEAMASILGLSSMASTNKAFVGPVFQSTNMVTQLHYNEKKKVKREKI